MVDRFLLRKAAGLALLFGTFGAVCLWQFHEGGLLQALLFWLAPLSAGAVMAYGGFLYFCAIEDQADARVAT